MKKVDSGSVTIVMFIVILAVVAFIGTCTARAEDICVPVGKEWIVNVDLVPLGFVRSKETGQEGLALLGKHDGSEFIVIVNPEDDEILALDFAPQDVNVPLFERGEGCTWRTVNTETKVETEYVPGVFVKRMVSM